MPSQSVHKRFVAGRFRGAALGLLIAVAGCGPTDIQTAKVAADDPTAFFRWKRDVGSQLTTEQQRQLELTQQELRLDIQLRQKASGHDAIEQAMCERLNHLTVKEALLLGAHLKWQRLAAERDDLQRVASRNAQLITKPGDLAAAAELARYRGTFQQRIERLTQELAGLESEIRGLGGPAPVLQLPASASRPPPITHAEALDQIAVLLESRRGSVTLTYGDRRVLIDWEGRDLEGSKRVEFASKRVVNGQGERVVIPVRIRGRWLLYEGADQAPALPDNVRAVLSAEELAKFKREWLELEAELWARQLEKELPDPAPDSAERGTDGG